MTPEHFHKQAQLRTAMLCLLGFFCLAAGAGLSGLAIAGALIPFVIAGVALVLGAGFALRVRRLTLELERENLDEIRPGRPWEEVKADLANLHKLHGKN